MIVDYLVPEAYTSFDLESRRNSGGGMMPNINARSTALATRYKVNLTNNVSELSSDFCLVECLWFAQAWNPNVSEAELNAQYVKRVDALCQTKSTKVLVCTELQILRLPWWVRGKINHYFAGIVVNSKSLWDIIVALDMTPIGYLNDAIDPYLFRPGKKTMSVIFLGALKHIKNPYTIFDVFHKLEGTGIERICIGSAAIWSNEKKVEDAELGKEIKACTDVWIPNASYVKTAYHISSVSIGINDTWHDVSSRSNQEELMAGIVSVGGRHEVFKERPGIHGLETADQFVQAIHQLTEGYTRIPYELCAASREWAKKHLSTDAFLRQFDEIIRSVYL